MVALTAVFPSEWKHRRTSALPRLRGGTQRPFRAPSAQTKRRKALSWCVGMNYPFPLPSRFVLTRPLVAPKPVTRHLVVAARPAEPTRPRSGDAVSDPTTFQDPPREAYPEEVLTHRFRPYGHPGDPPPPPPEDQMDLGVDDGHAEEGAAKDKDKERRKKRRIGEATDSPKKLKKAKTAAS